MLTDGFRINMYLEKEHHVVRYVPYKKQLRDEDDNPVGLLPQAFEMRLEREETSLSVNWLEFYSLSHAENVEKVVQGVRTTMRISKNGLFGVGNVGLLEDSCSMLTRNKVKVVYNGQKNKNNETHASIIRLPINDMQIMQCLATKVFCEIVENASVP